MSSISNATEAAVIPIVRGKFLDNVAEISFVGEVELDVEAGVLCGCACCVGDRRGGG